MRAHTLRNAAFGFVAAMAIVAGFAAPAAATLGGKAILIVSYDTSNPAWANGDFDNAWLELYDASGEVIYTGSTGTASPVLLANGGTCYSFKGPDDFYMQCDNLPAGTYTIGSSGHPKQYVYVLSTNPGPAPIEPLVNFDFQDVTLAPDTLTGVVLSSYNTATGWELTLDVPASEAAKFASAKFELYDYYGALVFSEAPFPTTSPSPFYLAAFDSNASCLTWHSGADPVVLKLQCYNLPVGQYTVGFAGVDGGVVAVDTTTRRSITAEPLAGTNAVVTLMSLENTSTTLTFSAVLAATGFNTNVAFAALMFLMLGSGALVLARRRAAVS